jgi:hypothetical protein
MGRFTGAYTLQPTGPMLFVYRPDPDRPLRFITDDGDEIQPFLMETDGASVPRLFWCFKWFGPFDWIDAAVIHDAMYEEHHAGIRDWSFTRANVVLREAMKAVGVPFVRRNLVFVAVQLFGRGVWNRY